MSAPQKTETEYQIESGGVRAGQPLQAKQGHKCCGRCCDVRRAVIICNLVNAGLVLLALLATIAARNVANDADDDAMNELAELPIGGYISVMCVKIVLSGVAAYGARSFNQWLVGAGAVMYSIEALLSLIILDIGGVVYAAFFAYPHFFLISEIRKGIMTPENYVNEEQSCCCV